MTFNYNNEEYEIIIQKKNNKNTYIRVKEDLKIYITTSRFTSNIFIEKLILENKKAIIKMLENQIKKNKEKESNFYLGNKINIVIINIVEKPYLEENTLYVKKEEDIEKWYRNEAKKVFKERLDYNYNKFTKNIPYPKLVIRKMSTRWGVNNKKLKKVTLNFDLIYKDIKYLDYVINHELSHFIHFNHSKDFWNLVEENEPNYKKIRKEMRE